MRKKDFLRTPRYQDALAKATKLGNQSKYGLAAQEVFAASEMLDYSETGTRIANPEEFANYLDRIYDVAQKIDDRARRRRDAKPEDIKELKETMLAIDADRRRLRGKEVGLGKIAGASAIVCLVIGIFFLSSNLVGNAITNLTNPGSNTIGVCFLIIGLVAGFFWLREKK